MKYALYNNKENRFVMLLATRMLSHETIYELTSDVEEVKELTDKPYTDAELRHFEEVAGVEKGSFENYKLSMQDEQAYTVYNARDKSLQAIHDYLVSSYVINVDLYERASLPDVFISSKDLEFLRLYLSIYYGFDTKIEKQNGYHNVDYLSLIVSWEDPKVPLVVFSKGED